jgi:hypothetical protein
LKIFDFTCTGGFSFVPLRVFAKQNGICQRLKQISSSEKQQHKKDILRGLELADYRMHRNKAMHHLMGVGSAKCKIFFVYQVTHKLKKHKTQ